jgi:hypothetical protein
MLKKKEREIKQLWPVSFGAESFVFQFSIQTFEDEDKLHRTIILPVFVHGYETWSLALREDLG